LFETFSQNSLYEKVEDSAFSNFFVPGSADRIPTIGWTVDEGWKLKVKVFPITSGLDCDCVLIVQ